MDDSRNNIIKKYEDKYEKNLNIYEKNNYNVNDPEIYNKNINDNIKTVFKYEDWQLDRIRKYFKNGIIPVSKADFDNKLKDGVSQELRTMLELAAKKILMRQDISGIIHYIGQLEREKSKKEENKYEPIDKFKEGNPYKFTSKELLNNDKNIEKNEISTPSANLHSDRDVVEAAVNNNPGAMSKNENLDILKKYFKNGEIPKLSDDLEEKLVDKSISDEIKKILNLIIIKYGIDEDISSLIDVLKRLDNPEYNKELILPENPGKIDLNELKEQPSYVFVEDELSGKPKEGELDLSRVKTGRNLYDILTYDEKIEFLKEHPEYSTSHLPVGFFSAEEARRFEEENPLYNLKNTHIDFDKLDLSKPSNDSIDLEGISIGDIKAPERISSDAEFRGIKIEDVNLEDTREFKISRARQRYREKSALWKFLNKSLNPDNINFDDLSDEEIDRLYR